jgi:hypothetical protein
VRYEKKTVINIKRAESNGLKGDLMKDKLTKRTIDFPDELYHLVMAYGAKHKLYKFGPSLIDIIKKALEDNNG